MKHFDNIAVAGFDILGLKNLLRQPFGSEKAFKILDHIWRNTTDPTWEDQEGKVGFFLAETAHFSDAIYLVANPEDRPEIQMQFLAAKASTLIGLAFQEGYPLRCGIAQGDLWIEEKKSLLKKTLIKKPFLLVPQCLEHMS